MSGAPQELGARAERIEADALASRMLAAPAAAAAALGLGVVVDHGVVGVFAGNADVLPWNRVVGLGVHQPASEAQLDRLLGAARALGVRRLLAHVVPEHAPPSLPAWIEARGGRADDQLVRLWRWTSQPPAASTTLRVQLLDRSHGAAFAALVASVFDMPAVGMPLIASTVGRPGWRHFGAFDGDALVATGALYVSESVGWLGFGATAATHRGRGAQGALIARRLAAAAQLGAEWVATETAEETPDRRVPSYRNMRRFGFAEAYRRRNYLVTLQPC